MQFVCGAVFVLKQVQFAQRYQLEAHLQTDRIKIKSHNKSGFILWTSAENFGATRLEDAPQQVVVALGMLNARHLNAIYTKPLSSTIALSKRPFNGLRLIFVLLN
jgi:hypothetical protein